MAYTKTTSRYIAFGPGTANFSVPVSWGYDLQDVKVGTKVDRWRARITRGEDASSNYSRETYVVEKMQSGGAVLHSTDFEYPGQVTGPNHSFERVSGYAAGTHRVPTAHLSSNISEVDAKALTLLYRRIRQETSHMNGLTFLGELRESLRMIKRPAKAIREGLLEYDRLLSKRKKSIHPRIPLEKKLDVWKDIIAGTWLEVSFGWKPLVSDTQAIAETIGRVLSKDDTRTRARSYFEQDLASSSSYLVDHFQNSTGIGSKTGVSTITTGGVQYVCQLKLVPSGPVNQLDRIRSLSGLTLENFVPTLYELTPWSFLLDYFTNVGDIIESTFTNTASVGWVVRTTRLRTAKEVNSQAYVSQVFNPPFLNFKGFDTIGAGYSKIVKSSVQRERITHLGVPDLVFSLPGSPQKLGNIAALLSPLYHSKFRF